MILFYPVYMCAGIYIHIPFCKSRCSYCDFATDVYRDDESVENYINALISEITNYQLPTTNHVETIYFGGGTPSLLTTKQLEKILDVIFAKFEFTENIEFTLEMNPATVSLRKLKDFRSLGVNRASFGVQTFDDKALKILARGHTANDARGTFALLRKAGFENISFDLIAGLPNQTIEDWEKNLYEALELNPEHLSLYLLEIHEGTPLAEQIRSKRQPTPDEDLAGEMYQLMCEKVSAKGFEQYEISNFAKAGFESRHNIKYWQLEPVFGFGVSAHSFDGRERYANERERAAYVEQIESYGKAEVFREQIDRASEFAFLGLRLKKGIDLAAYEARFGVDLQNKLKNFRRSGLVEVSGGRLRLTQRGMLFSNEVFAEFV